MTGGILMLSIAVLVLRYASYKYPSARANIRGGGGDQAADDMG